MNSLQKNIILYSVTKYYEYIYINFLLGKVQSDYWKKHILRRKNAKFFVM